MSRNAAKRQFRGDQLQKDMEKKRSLSDSVIGSGESLLARLSGAKLKEIFELMEQ